MVIVISFLVGFTVGAVAARIYYAETLAKLKGMEEWAKRKIESKV